MNIGFRNPESNHKNICILVFMNWFSKIVHLAAIHKSITAHGCASVFIDTVFFTFDSMAYPVNWYRIETLGSRRSFGNTCSSPWKDCYGCILLTMMKQMVRQNMPIVSVEKRRGRMMESVHCASRIKCETKMIGGACSDTDSLSPKMGSNDW